MIDNLSLPDAITEQIREKAEELADHLEDNIQDSENGTLYLPDDGREHIASFGAECYRLALAERQEEPGCSFVLQNDPPASNNDVAVQKLHEAAIALKRPQQLAYWLGADDTGVAANYIRRLESALAERQQEIDGSPSYYAKALSLVADTLMTLEPEKLPERAPKMMAIIRHAAQALAQAEQEIATLQASVQAAKAEIDAAWFGIEHGYDIESREDLERQSKTNGFKFGLAQAVHHIWKRDPKVQAAKAEALEEAASDIDLEFHPTVGQRQLAEWLRIRAVSHREPA